MERIFHVKDFFADAKNDSEAIESCFAVAGDIAESKTVVFDGKDYFIDRAI
jgi:hypothetical protein